MNDVPTFAQPPPRPRRCVLPWVLLLLLVIALAAALYWGYTKRVTMAEYAVSSLLDQELDELLPEADFVSLHCPLTPDTRGLIDARALARMKTTAYLINTARGPLVEQAALLEALREKRIAGAGLDVYEIEPLPENPFVEFDNVVLTPHCAGHSLEAIQGSLEMALENITRVLRGQEPLYRIN